MQLKELVIIWRITGWTEDMEKGRDEKNDACQEQYFLYLNKYKDTVLELPNSDNNTLYVD